MVDAAKCIVVFDALESMSAWLHNSKCDDDIDSASDMEVGIYEGYAVSMFTSNVRY